MSCGPAPTPTGTYDGIHVGVQRAREVVGLVRGDAEQAVFEFDVAVKDGRFAGPYVHGRAGQRFIYLSWGEVVGDDFRMFRRAKLHVDHLDVAEAEGRVVEGALALKNEKGHPLCASVRPPLIEWTIR